MLVLERSLLFDSRVTCEPVLTKDSHTAYFACEGGVKIVDLVKGQKRDSNIGLLSTNYEDPIEALAMLEDEIVGISPILVVGRVGGHLECWGMRFLAQAELIWEGAPQDICTYTSFDVCVRRKPSRAVGKAIELEILVAAGGVVRVFSITVDGLSDATRCNQTVDAIRDLEKVAVNEKELQFSSSRNRIPLQGHFADMRLIRRGSGIYAVFASGSQLALLNVYTGKIVAFTDLDGDDFFSSMDISSNTNCILLGTGNGVLYKWKLEEGESGLPILRSDRTMDTTSSTRGRIETVMWCCNGLAIAVDRNQCLIVWQIESRKIIVAKTVQDAYIESIAFLKSRESDENFVAYRSCTTCTLYKICDNDLRKEICMEVDSSDTRALSRVLEQVRCDLQPVREINRKTLCAYPASRLLPISAVPAHADNFMLPRQLTKCGCAPIAAYDTHCVHQENQQFKYHVLSVQDPVRKFQIIPGILHIDGGPYCVLLFHLYENS